MHVLQVLLQRNCYNPNNLQLLIVAGFVVLRLLLQLEQLQLSAIPYKLNTVLQVLQLLL
jgi:hypothetical protein